MLQMQILINLRGNALFWRKKKNRKMWCVLLYIWWPILSPSLSVSRSGSLSLSQYTATISQSRVYSPINRNSCYWGSLMAPDQTAPLLFVDAWQMSLLGVALKLVGVSDEMGEWKLPFSEILCEMACPCFPFPQHQRSWKIKSGHSCSIPPPPSCSHNEQ